MTHEQLFQSVLLERFDVQFDDPALLRCALIHSSYLNENAGGADAVSNERLEFLGDAVLGYLVAEWLYSTLPDAPEGEMTRLRSLLVRRDTLVGVAESLGLGGYLLMGIGEEASGGRTRPANLANAVEAVIGAVHLDQGAAVTRRLIIALLNPILEQLVSSGAAQDAKSRLQELLQSQKHLTPAYRIIDARGPSHGREFTVEVSLGGEPLAVGIGPSKRVAEQLAARAALDGLEEQAGPT
ncbi:MAG: ribonuclease III [Chloroflexi bacterium]|nr:ribonuclease III [Chloroflexota bacterium]